jgi:hypothetical protein
MADGQRRGWRLFRPEPIGGELPPELRTGHEQDDDLMRQIAARAELGRPRELRHFLLVPDEEIAQPIGQALAQLGFGAEICSPNDGTGPWLVIALTEDVVLTGDLIRRGRQLFESLAAEVPGGAEYDGWEVSISEDELLAATEAASALPPA